MTTLYQQDDDGIRFSTERKSGQVWIANYVYDLWMPLLGAEAIGVYSAYCRLERNEGVRKMKLEDLARAFRIGKKKLMDIHRDLQRCGFIRVIAPQGQKRLMHWTTEIVVLDPPREVSAEIIKEFQHPQGYQALSHWLVQVEPPDVPGRTPDGSTENRDDVPDRTPNIASLNNAPLESNAKKTLASPFGAARQPDPDPALTDSEPSQTALKESVKVAPPPPTPSPTAPGVTRVTVPTSPDDQKPKPKDLAHQARAALFDALVTGVGKDRLPADFSFSPYIKPGGCMDGYVKGGATADNLRLAGGIFGAWLDSEPQAFSWTVGDVTTSIRTAVKLGKDGVRPEHVPLWLADVRKKDKEDFWLGRAIPWKHLCSNIVKWLENKSNGATNNERPQNGRAAVSSASEAASGPKPRLIGYGHIRVAPPDDATDR